MNTLFYILSLLTDWSLYHLIVSSEDTISLQSPQMCLVHFLIPYKIKEFYLFFPCLTLSQENHISYHMSNLTSHTILFVILNHYCISS